jgi:uncharacterized protein
LLLPFWNSQEKRPRALVRIVIQFAVRVGFLVALATLLGAVATSLGDLPAGQGWRYVLKHWSPLSLSYRAAILVIEPAAALASVWLAVRLLDKRPLRSLGFRFRALWWADLAFGLFVGVAVMAAVLGVGVAAGWMEIQATLVKAPGVASVFAPLALAFVGQVGNGVEEELADRAYWLRNGAEGLRRLGPRGSVIAAYVLTSVMFGLGHMGNPDASALFVPNLVVIGLFFGLSYVTTGELALGIGLHTTWNLAQAEIFGIASFNQEVSLVSCRLVGGELWTGGKVAPEGGLLCLFACAIGAALVALWVRLTRKKLALATDCFSKGD